MINDDEDEPRPQYQVGYKRPPTEHQFKKGVAGNKKGRPRRKTNFDLGGKMDAQIAELILSEAGRSVSVRENGRAEDVPIKAALLRTLNHSALKGDLRSQVEALKLILAAERMKVEQKTASVTKCPKCAELEGMSDDQLIEDLMGLLETGKLKLPNGIQLEVRDDDEDDDPWQVG